MSEKDNKLPWFRLYTETIDDEKLRLLAFEDRWHFIALLCCKGSGMLDSDDPLLRRKLSVKLGLAMREIDEVARRLSDVGLIDFESLQPIAWEDRQMRSDVSTARVKAYRDRMKRYGNVSETAQEVDLDTDTDIDNYKNPMPDDMEKKRVPDVDERFELAWKSYPKRPGMNKAATLKCWNARKREGESVENMISGVKNYANYCKHERKEPSFILQPTTFFGKTRRYADEYAISGHDKRPPLNSNLPNVSDYQPTKPLSPDELAELGKYDLEF